MELPGEQLVTKEEQLVDVARLLIPFAMSCPVWAFYGNMGAGKTTFIRTICSELGVRETVTSPTFSLVNEYSTADGRPVYHFDFYRIENEREAIDIGCEEYFESGHLCMIEWPEKILNLLPHPHIRIHLLTEANNRRISFLYD